MLLAAAVATALDNALLVAAAAVGLHHTSLVAVAVAAGGLGHIWPADHLDSSHLLVAVEHSQAAACLPAENHQSLVASEDAVLR
jgi:hypothetical protein